MNLESGRRRRLGPRGDGRIGSKLVHALLEGGQRVLLLNRSAPGQVPTLSNRHPSRRIVREVHPDER